MTKHANVELPYMLIDIDNDKKKIVMSEILICKKNVSIYNKEEHPDQFLLSVHFPFAQIA